MNIYHLITWPMSQDCIGRPECFLINPTTAIGIDEEYPQELDSSYMVPCDEDDPSDDAYVLITFPEAQEWYGKEGTVCDYDTNVFVPYREYVNSKTTKQ